MARKLAMILSGLALLACAASTIYLLGAPFYQGIETVQTESGYDTIQTTKTLAEVNGTRVVYLLVGITLASSAPLIISRIRPNLQRLVTWTVALGLIAFSLLGSLTVGLAYMPSAILLLLAAIATLFIRKDAGQ